MEPRENRFRMTCGLILECLEHLGDEIIIPEEEARKDLKGLCEIFVEECRCNNI